METPSFTHLSHVDYSQVYEPSEDSFLLIDSLEQDLDRIRKLRPSICLEVGSGSGVIVTALGKTLGSDSSYIAVDINRRACEVTKEMGKKNGVMVDVVHGDLVKQLRLGGQVDMLVFNPPYVVTESVEIEGQLARAWAGGIRGREVMDRLFADVPKLLSPQGLFYLLVLKENYVDDIGRLMANLGFVMAIIKERKIRGEHLLVLRFSRADC